MSTWRPEDDTAVFLLLKGHCLDQAATPASGLQGASSALPLFCGGGGGLELGSSLSVAAYSPSISPARDGFPAAGLGHSMGGQS